MSDKDLRFLCDIIGYNFKNMNILQNALLHSSAAFLKKTQSNERMEFFGDSILGFVICEFLYKKYNNKSEGELSKMRSFLISRKICSEIGKKLKINDFLILSNGAEQNQERYENANIANAVEAIIAGIYLDGGIENAKDFILKQWKEFLALDNTRYDVDHKTKLQQIAQNKYKALPIYKIISINGSDHSPIFTSEVSLHAFSAMGQGKNKKDAEQSAALKMLEILKI